MNGVYVLVKHGNFPYCAIKYNPDVGVIILSTVKDDKIKSSLGEKNMKSINTLKKSKPELLKIRFFYPSFFCLARKPCVVLKLLRITAPSLERSPRINALQPWEKSKTDPP